MAIFRPEEESWERLDYATICGNGVACISLSDVVACRSWLQACRYTIESIDCSVGFNAVCAQVSTLFKWEEQFGYTYEGHSLDALNDGFTFDVPEEGGVVLELQRLDLLWLENPHWSTGLLSIASDYSRREMASGRRFFAIVTTKPGAPIIEQVFGEQTVPWPSDPRNFRLPD